MDILSHPFFILYFTQRDGTSIDRNLEGKPFLCVKRRIKKGVRQNVPPRMLTPNLVTEPWYLILMPRIISDVQMHDDGHMHKTGHDNGVNIVSNIEGDNQEVQLSNNKDQFTSRTFGTVPYDNQARNYVPGTSYMIQVSKLDVDHICRCKHV